MALPKVIVLGDGFKVPTRVYVQAVKLAKANPGARFDRGFTTWWPVTGAEIVQQFRSGLHDRINQRGALQ